MRQRTQKKPRKPAGFPLTAHPNGQWSKKVRGKVYYFGKWDDPDGALRRYHAIANDLHAGRHIEVRTSADLTITDLGDLFLTERHKDAESGKLSPKMFIDYKRVCLLLGEHFGGDTRIMDLRPHDFGPLRVKLARKRGSHELSRYVRMVRTILLWAYRGGHIDREVRYGGYFDAPSKADRRKNPSATLITAPIARLLVAATRGQLRAMVLLGFNCGFGQGDCAQLQPADVDLDAAMIRFPRPKTGIDREASLWPETVAALRPYVLKDRPVVFATKHGNPWVRVKKHYVEGKLTKAVNIDSVSLEFGKVCKALGISAGFYDLRHTFRTIADEVPDQHAVWRIMGHQLPGMASVYVRAITPARLRAVTNHVRHWFYCGA